MIRIKKLNSLGFAHHLLVPLIVATLIGGIGVYLLQRSQAATAYTNGAIYLRGEFLSPTGGQLKGNYDFYPLTHTVEFSPDGSKIVYAKPVNNEDPKGSQISDVYVANSDGSSISKIASAVMSPQGFSWSNDGTKVYFGTADESYYGHYITAAKIDGSSVETFSVETETNGNTSSLINTSVHPINGRIFYAYKGNLCSTAEQGIDILCSKIAFNDSITRFMSQVKVSPDGTRVLVTSYEADYTNCQFSCPSATNVYSVTTLGTDVKKITHNTLSTDISSAVLDAMWSPDGANALVSYYAGAESGTYLIDPNGQKGGKLSDHVGYVAWQPIPAGQKQSPLPSNTITLKCEITPPTTALKAGQSLAVNAIVTNLGPGPVTVKPNVAQIVSNLTGPGTTLSSGPLTIDVPANQSKAVTLPAVTIPYASSSSEMLYIFMNDVNLPEPLACMTSIPLPQPTLTVNGLLTRNVPYNKTTSITGSTRPNSSVQLKSGAAVLATVNSTSTGSFSLPYTFKDNMSVYIKLQNFSTQSSTISVKVHPTVNGAATRTVKKGSTVKISGTFKPNTTLTVSMRKPADAAGTYPRKFYPKTDASGNYSFTFTADTKKVFYVTSPNGASSSIHTVLVN